MTNSPQFPGVDVEGPGLCWIILGAPEGKAGIVMDQRPANTALGKFPSLLPIVVATKTYSDALVVDNLRISLERKGIDRNNYSALRAFFAQEGVSELLTGYEKFYAIRVGKETGIWVDYTWDEIEHLKEFTGAKYKSHTTFQDALLWMIEKAPHNRPPKKTSAQISSPGKPVLGGVPNPPSQAPPPPPVFPVAPVFVDESHRGGSPSKAAHVLTAPMQSLSVSSSTGLEDLRAVIRPLPSQVPAVAGYSAFNLGARADAFLRGRNADDGMILKVLRARLYACSRDEFVLSLSVEMNWKESDSKELWKLIDLPGI